MHGRPDTAAPDRRRHAPPRREMGAGGDGLAAWGDRALLGGGLPALLGADGLFFVVLPDEPTLGAHLERDGDVEADRQQCGEE